MENGRVCRWTLQSSGTEHRCTRGNDVRFLCLMCFVEQILDFGRFRFLLPRTNMVIEVYIEIPLPICFSKSTLKHLLFFSSFGSSLDRGPEVERHSGPQWEGHDLVSRPPLPKKKRGSKTPISSDGSFVCPAHKCFTGPVSACHLIPPPAPRKGNTAFLCDGAEQLPPNNSIPAHHHVDTAQQQSCPFTDSESLSFGT